jgi:hypothetical protein
VPGLLSRALSECIPLRVSASKTDNPDKALSEFEGIVDMEEEKGEWSVFPTLLLCVPSCHELTPTYTRGFKALKQATKLTFRLKRFEDSLRYYTRLLTYTKKAVTRKCAQGFLSSLSARIGNLTSSTVWQRRLLMASSITSRPVLTWIRA